MASHGKKRHLKRLAAPKSLPIPSKGSIYLLKPAAGRHSKQYAMSALMLVRDVLKVTRDRREAKRIFLNGEILIDGVAVRDEKFPVGLMDLISIPKLSAFYRVVLKHNELAIVPVKKEEVAAKLCKITDKRIVKGGRIQLCLHDGRTQLIEKEEDRFRVGDTVKLSVPKQQVAGFLKLEKNARCYVFHGKHSGEVGTLEEIKERPGSKASDAFLKGEGSHQIITRKNYLFVVPEEFKVSA